MSRTDPFTRLAPGISRFSLQDAMAQLVARQIVALEVVRSKLTCVRILFGLEFAFQLVCAPAGKGTLTAGDRMQGSGNMANMFAFVLIMLCVSVVGASSCLMIQLKL